MRAIDAEEFLKKSIEERRFFVYREDVLNNRFEVMTIYDDLINAVNEMPTIEPKQEWISVKDRLPEKDTLVLCVGAKGGMFLGYIRSLYGDDKTAYVRVPNARSGRYAAFWMPLPEPPEKNNEEEQA